MVIIEYIQFQHKAEHTYDALPEESRDRSEIVDELKAWKQEHEKFVLFLDLRCLF
jgi:hypothetical protein